MTLSSRGGRSPSSPGRVHAGHASRKRLPWGARDAVDAGGYNGLGHRNIGQDSGEATRQLRLPFPRRAEEQQVVIRIPVSLSTLSPLRAGVDGHGSHFTFLNAPQSVALSSSSCCDHL
jgi:hypothetical protein